MSACLLLALKVSGELAVAGLPAMLNSISRNWTWLRRTLLQRLVLVGLHAQQRWMLLYQLTSLTEELIELSYQLPNPWRDCIIHDRVYIEGVLSFGWARQVPVD